MKVTDPQSGKFCEIVQLAEASGTVAAAPENASRFAVRFNDEPWEIYTRRQLDQMVADSRHPEWRGLLWIGCELLRRYLFESNWHPNGVDTSYLELAAR